MREVVLLEDRAHQTIVGALVQRLADEHHVPVRLDWHNAVGGHGQVVKGHRRYLRDLKGQASPCDLVIVATDANCRGRRERTREFKVPDTPVPTVWPFRTPILNAGCCLTVLPSERFWAGAAAHLTKSAAAVATRNFLSMLYWLRDLTHTSTELTMPKTLLPT